ncbi:MAG: hypothetical protein M3491_05365 [Actinomycetota bacterium]|nr:hypothetical protein [Rubrobacteraceae bacterium]MDQ3301863.1 hypothetical protein [Actinomycetota bacterium]MDQ3436756.1 hypothetical protein [Actinomycetota bacterium]
MKRSLTLTLLLATTFAIVACGGSEAGQSGRSTPAEPQQTQAESDQQSAPEESTREEASRERVPANDEAAESEQGPAQEGDERAGLSVTTIEGEEVKLGGQGDVTALFFMAGW